ncbi:MAG: transglutaminase domain-containing protein [Candidatus Zhuqueibacterota bacterium]
MKPMKLIGIILFLFSTGHAQMGAVLDFFPSPGSRPTGLAWDGEFLWNADIGTNQIYKIDPQTGQVLYSLPSPANATINGLAWDGQFLWCSDNGHDQLCQIDVEDSSITKIVPVGTENPRGLTWDGEFLWYVDSQAKRIFKLNPETGSYADTLISPGGYNRGLAWDGEYLWCADYDKDEIYRLETDRGRIFTILNAPGTYSYGLAFDGHFLWNADYEHDRIYKISIAGTEKYQITDPFLVKIRYTVTIKNVGSSVMNLQTYLACPFEAVYQQLEDTLQFRDEPHTFYTDYFGQQIAYYEESVPAGEEKLYQWSVPATLYNIRYFLHPDSVGELTDIPQSIITMYTPDGEYYDITHPVIRNAAQEAIGDESNLYWQVRNIHDYVISHIEYINDSSWDTAPIVLSRGTGSCSEYTFLFVALCRAAGIPARMEAGGHLRDDLPYEDRIFHRWQQVYFPNYGWVPIDCTWDDKEYPGNQARYFGAMSNQAFSTTISGGGVTGMWWTYNVANSSSGGEMEREKLMEWLPNSTAVEIVPDALPEKYETSFNYPNPLNNATTIQFYAERPGPANVQIFNPLGQLIKSWPNLIANPGWNRVLWNGQNNAGQSVASGVYLYRIETCRGAQWYKLTVIK